MASTDTLDSSATAECPQSDRLKHYLSGWLNESDSEQLELHLQQCDTCESALRTLETQQDTLLQSLQATVAQSVSPAGASASAATMRTSEPLASNDARPKPAASSDANASLVLTAAAQVATSSNAPELDAAMSKVRRLFDAPAEQESQAFIRSWHPAQRDFGIYELIRPLGRGGMGAVYLAKHRQLGRHVAIKLLPMMSAEDDDVRTRFDREIRVVGRLSHPSIVAATDAGEIDGTQYLVMEYVAGMDLSRLSRLMGRLPVADACELIRQAALGLSCAHAEGVVHRDIKPSNMMLDELGHIRILDFGLAQWTVWDEASVDLTTVGQLMGTLDYMAPEQAEASSGVDYRADLYALGATLFRLLCGRAPLAAAPNQSPLEKLRLLANHQPPKLSTLCPEAPEELVKLVASLLSRSAADRPASAAHVAEQLAPFAEGSKLVELLQQAREKAAASPEPARKSASPDRAVFTESAPVTIAPQPETTGKGGSRILRRLLLAASLPLMILAGILIKLELSKGQLIIESDVDNVNVKLLKEGKPVDGIQVTHGTTSTRLHADTYEITIDGPSDGLIIDHDKFTLKNGETVIARIQQVPRVAKEAGSAADKVPGSINFNNEPPGSRESTVVQSDGKPPVVNPKRPAASAIEPPADEVPFKTQIQTLLQSKNEAELIKLFDKRLKLAAAPPEPELALTLIEQLPTFPVTMKIGHGSRSEHNYVLDFHAFNFIAKSCPKKFFAMWRQSFEATESESWRMRLIERLQSGMSGNTAETEGRKQDVSAFEAWFVDYIKASPTPNPEKEKLVPLIASQVLKRSGMFSQNPTLVAAVEASPFIKPDWWLVPVSKDPSSWSLVEKKRFSAALDVLRDKDCNEADLAKACIIFALAIGEEEDGLFFQNEGDTPPTLKEDRALLKLIDDLLQQRLHHLIVSPDENLWKMVTLSERFRSPLSVSDLQLSSRFEGSYQTLPVAEFLDLVFVLRDESIADPDLKALFEKCKTGRAKVKLSGYDLRLWLATTEIQWGTFQVAATNGITVAANRTPQECSDQLWGVGSKPTEADWIQFCLLYHKALAPYRKEFEAAQTRTKTEPPMPSPAEPLYNGQPLEHWLEMLSRERSVEGLKAAFEACAALLTPQNSETVTETLYKVLAGLDGDLQVTDKEQNRVWTLDYEAATILRKANPGSKFFVRWVTARTASTNAEWNKRLLTYISYSGPESFDDLKPVVSWAGSVLSQDVSSNADAVAIADAAVLLRGFLNYESVRDYAELAKTSTDILINCPQLNEDWWISQPIQYRSSNGNKEFGTPAFRDKVASVAIRVLLREDSSPSQVAQACMILANGATLNDEQKRSVLTVIQRRLEQLAKDKEALIATTTVPESFSEFAAPVIASNSPLPVNQIMIATPSSMARHIPVTSTSLVVQLLNVVFTIDDGKTTEPQQQLLFEATRGVFDIVMSARPKAMDEPESAVSRGFRTPPNAFAGLYWPDLELTGRQKFGNIPQLPERVAKELWGDHAPTKSDWMHFIILTHPAMKDVVNRAIEDRKNVAPPVEVPKP
ncbi:MAG: serine/threonine-protein kinase [Planctomycetaceae bacterium]